MVSVGPIIRTREDGRIRGVKVLAHHFLTHSFFVDDVLIFGDGTSQECYEYKEILKLFFRSSGMEVNFLKSIIH